MEIVRKITHFLANGAHLHFGGKHDIYNIQPEASYRYGVVSHQPVISLIPIAQS